MTRKPYDLRGLQPSCPECGYDLQGTVSLSGARCPECGTRLPFHRLRFAGGRMRWRLASAGPVLRAAVRLAVTAAIAVPLWLVLVLMHASPTRATGAVLTAIAANLIYRFALPPRYRIQQVFMLPAMILVVAFADWREQISVMFVAGVIIAVIAVRLGRS